MNVKTFEVVVDVALDRAAWRSLGYGDQPSKSEVMELFTGWLGSHAELPGLPSQVSVRYSGAPGAYQVHVLLDVDQPWWRRAGFGDTVSKKEVRQRFNRFVMRVAKSYKVTVSLVKQR